MRQRRLLSSVLAGSREAQGLTPAHVKDTLRLLTPDAMALEISPASGLAFRETPEASNLLRLARAALAPTRKSEPRLDGLEAGGFLAQDLFVRLGGDDSGSPLTLTRGKSNASYHLDATGLGHLLGLAVSRSDRARVARCLKEDCGLDSNKIHGEWTGVSLARYHRLIDWIRSANERGNLGSLMMARAAWEKAAGKADLLRYLLALHAHVPVFRSEELALRLRNPESSEAHEFVSSKFHPHELTDDDRLREASLRCAPAPGDDAEALELLVAAMASANTLKPAVKLHRHTFGPDGKPVPDCTEVAVREVFDLIVFDPVLGRFDATRLPATVAPGVRAFYERVVWEEASEAVRSKMWFDLLQRIPGCKYISASSSASPHVLDYELWPGTENLARCVGALWGAPAPWRDLTPLAAEVNALRNDDNPLRVRHSSEVIRSTLVSDDVRRRETIELFYERSSAVAELTMEADHRLATATHRRRSSEAGGYWSDAAVEILKRDGNRSSFLAGRLLTRSLLGGDYLLDEAIRDLGSSRLEEDRVLGAFWGEERARRWRPLENAPLVAGGEKPQHVARAEKRSLEARWMGALKLCRDKSLLLWLLTEYDLESSSAETKLRAIRVLRDRFRGEEVERLRKPWARNDLIREGCLISLKQSSLREGLSKAKGWSNKWMLVRAAWTL